MLALEPDRIQLFIGIVCFDFFYLLVILLMISRAASRMVMPVPLSSPEKKIPKQEPAIMPIKHTTTITMQVTPLPGSQSRNHRPHTGNNCPKHLFRGFCRSFRHGCPVRFVAARNVWAEISADFTAASAERC